VGSEDFKLTIGGGEEGSTIKILAAEDNYRIWVLALLL